MDEVEVGVMSQAGAEEVDHTQVGFDGDDLGGVDGQAFGEWAGAGADFEHHVLCAQFGGVHDAGEVGFVQEEVLSQALAWGKTCRA